MLERNLQEVIERIEKTRIAYSRHHIVRMVAISKYQSKDAIALLYDLGQRAFGENKVQDLRDKHEALKHLPLEWHYVGTLQSNKINTLLALQPTLYHSLHSIEIAKELEKRLEASNKSLRVLVQVNSAKEESKSGFMPEELLESYEHIASSCPHLQLCGLMSIGAHTDEQHAIQKSFEITKNLFDSLKNAEILSMGMSNDFELAIACGSNMVRIGSVLFKKGGFL